MRKSHQARYLMLAAFATISWTSFSEAGIIGGWDFNEEAQGAFNMSPAPSVNNQVSGVPTAVPLGMWNTYTLSAQHSTPPVPVMGSIDGQDLIATPGTSHDATDQAWRVRGDTNNVYPAAQLIESNPGLDNPAVGNGWSISAPERTQGAQFNFNTTGYHDVVFTYDVFSTNQGVRNQQIQYTADGGTTWHTVAATGVGADATGILGFNVAVGSPGNEYNIMTPNDFINGITVDFGALGIHSVDNDPNFGVRLVSIYDPTYSGPGAPTYTSATIANGQYNNNSGNWRFDNVFLSGVSAVPEPASILLGTLGFAGLLMFRRMSRAAK